MKDLRSVLGALNKLIEQGLIHDYAIGGGYAVMWYDLPVSTFDLDILVILSGEEDFHKLYEHFRKQDAKIEDVYIYIEDMPVQFLPNYISPLFNHAIIESTHIEIDGIHTKVVSLEYLIVLLLTSFRPKDKIRIQSLLGKADSILLLDIIKRFDDGKSEIYKRYQEILGNT
jgi:predicted nucleotidyltransferase